MNCKSLFITGTGTDVGKTYITALIVKKLREKKNPAYFKAAMSGNIRDENKNIIPGDAVWVKKISGIEQSIDSMCPYIYEHALSPHLASKIEENKMDLDTVFNHYDNLSKAYNYITLEGAGGIFCPLRYDDIKIFQEDIIKIKHLPCVIVADAGLGTINSVVLTVEYMKSKSISIKGIIFNNYDDNNVMHKDNALMCIELTGIDIIAYVKKGDKDINIDVETLKSLYE